MRYLFADFVLDLRRGCLDGPAGAIHLRPQTIRLLEVLVAGAPAMVGREELLDRVWGTRHLSPGSLKQAISELRQALGDPHDVPLFIETVHRRGYRFIAAVEQLAEPPASQLIEPPTPQPAEPPAPSPEAAAPAGPTLPLPAPAAATMVTATPAAGARLPVARWLGISALLALCSSVVFLGGGAPSSAPLAGPEPPAAERRAPPPPRDAPGSGIYDLDHPFAAEDRPPGMRIAPTCSELIRDDGTVLLGEVRGTGHLGVCVRRPDGRLLFYDVPACNVGTPMGQTFHFISSEQYDGLTTIAPATLSIDCGGNRLDPFPPAFRFGLWFTGNAGSDVAYGTPHRDYLHGNSELAGRADHAFDRLCGYHDDDVLVGDLEDAAAGDVACLDGGTNFPNGDQCHSGDFADCEQHTGSGEPVAGCDCGPLPPQIW